MANKIPMAAAVPMCAKGGDSLKFSAKKLMAVVILVNTTGIKLISMLFCRACFLSSPAESPWE